MIPLLCRPADPHPARPEHDDDDEREERDDHEDADWRVHEHVHGVEPEPPYGLHAGDVLERRHGERLCAQAELLVQDLRVGARDLEISKRVGVETIDSSWT